MHFLFIYAGCGSDPGLTREAGGRWEDREKLVQGIFAIFVN